MSRLDMAARRFREAGGRMKALGAALRARVVKAKPLLPDLRDLHVYGGAALVAGGAWLSPWPWVAPALFGGVLLYLGLRRP